MPHTLTQLTVSTFNFLSWTETPLQGLSVSGGITASFFWPRGGGFSQVEIKTTKVLFELKRPDTPNTKGWNSARQEQFTLFGCRQETS